MNNDALGNALESVLDDAAHAVDAEIGSMLQEPAEDIQFSPESQRRMKALFRRERRKLRVKKLRRFSKWAACILLAVVVTSGVTVFSVRGLRVRFLNFILETGAPNTDYSFGDDGDQSYSDDEIALEYIPEGFKLELNNSTDKTVYLQFTNKDYYFDIIVNRIDGRTSMDTENGIAETIDVNGVDGVYTSNENINSLIWHNDDYSFRVIGNIQKEELIKIANNVKI